MENPAPFYGAVRGFTAYMLYGALTRWLGKDVEKLANAISHYVALTSPTYLPYVNTSLENHDVGRAATAFGEILETGYVIIHSLQACPRYMLAANVAKRGRQRTIPIGSRTRRVHIRLFGNY